MPDEKPLGQCSVHRMHDFRTSYCQRPATCIVDGEPMCGPHAAGVNPVDAAQSRR